MRFSLPGLLIMTMTTIPSLTVAQDDWIGLDAKTSWIAGMRFTEGETGDSTQSVYLSLTSPDDITLDLQYSDTNLVDKSETFESENFFGQLNLPVDGNIYLGFNYLFQGNQKELEIEQLGLLLSYDAYPLFTSLEYNDGDLYIFTRDDISPILNIPDSVRSELSATTLQLGWWFNDISLFFLHQQYDYEKDISALETRPLLQLLVKPAALTQAGLLIDSSSSISLSFLAPQRELTGHLFTTRSALDKSETRSIQLDWMETLGSQSSLFLSLNRSDEAEDNWSFSAGLEWSH